MAASVFNQEAVLEFIIQRGGRVTNHELVTRFKVALNDPSYKGILFYFHDYPCLIKIWRMKCSIQQVGATRLTNNTKIEVYNTQIEV